MAEFRLFEHGVSVRVAITGGTGLIGRALTIALRDRGDEVFVLTRQETADPGDIQWDPRRGIPNVRRLEAIDALVNLTGAPLATRPWTKPRRKLLLDSRVAATHKLMESLSRLEEPPVVFVGVGSLGVFGSRGDEWIGDDDERGTGFLAEAAGAWEDAHAEAREVLGARPAVLRMGMVLSSRGGALPHLIGPMRAGFAGWLGDGEQFTAWVSLNDCVRALTHLLDTPTAKGCFNANSPSPVRNKEWVQALGAALGRDVHGHAPKWALRGALGELADGYFLASMRARSDKLLASGFAFDDTDIWAVAKRMVDEYDCNS